MSKESRIVDRETGEPLTKGYPPYALEFHAISQRDLVLAVALVMEDLKHEGVSVEKYNVDPDYPHAPNIFGTLNGQKLHVFVRASRFPQMPVLENSVISTAPVMAKERKATAYFASVGLMPAEGQEGYFFVNYRGCQPIR